MKEIPIQKNKSYTTGHEQILHNLARKLNSDGNVDSQQILHNLEQGAVGSAQNNPQVGHGGWARPSTEHPKPMIGRLVVSHPAEGRRIVQMPETSITILLDVEEEVMLLDDTPDEEKTIISILLLKLVLALQS